MRATFGILALFLCPLWARAIPPHVAASPRDVVVRFNYADAPRDATLEIAQDGKSAIVRFKATVGQTRNVHALRLLKGDAKAPAWVRLNEKRLEIAPVRGEDG